MRALAESLLVSAALVLAAPAALAAPSARLAYVRAPGAEGCVDEEGLRKAVAARLGYDPFFPWAKVTVVAHVRKEGGGFKAEVTLVDEAGVSRGARALHAPGDDCRPLVGALALSISLALDPLSLTRPPGEKVEPPKPPPEPDVGGAPEAPPARVEPPAPPAREPPPPVEEGPPPLRGFLSAGGLGSAGVTPGLAPGGLVRVSLERGGWSVGLEASATGPTSRGADTGGRVKAWLAEGRLLGCGAIASPFFGCTFVAAGPLVAEGDGLRVTRSAILPLVDAGARLGARGWVAPWLRVEGFAEASLLLTRRALQVDGKDAYRQPLVFPGLGLALATPIF